MKKLYLLLSLFLILNVWDWITTINGLALGAEELNFFMNYFITLGLGIYVKMIAAWLLVVVAIYRTKRYPKLIRVYEIIYTVANVLYFLVILNNTRVILMLSNV